MRANNQSVSNQTESWCLERVSGPHLGHYFGGYSRQSPGGYIAYDSQIYGSLKGKVEFISPDTLKDDRRTEEETYYRVMVRTETGFLLHRGAQLPVIPGMTATVDILTGKRTVADYLLKPVLRLDEAFRER